MPTWSSVTGAPEEAVEAWRRKLIASSSAGMWGTGILLIGDRFGTDGAGEGGAKMLRMPFLTRLLFGRVVGAVTGGVADTVSADSFRAATCARCRASLSGLMVPVDLIGLEPRLVDSMAERKRRSGVGLALGPSRRD
jgi:hypothetical protein